MPGVAKLVPFAGGFATPVAARFHGDRIYVADQLGFVHGLWRGSRSFNPVLDLSTTFKKLKPARKGEKRGLDLEGYDERGLLGLELHPAFPADPRVFICYSAPAKGRKYNHLARLSQFEFVTPDLIDPRSEKVLLEVPEEAFTHNGGCLRFGPDGRLYWSLGDGGCCRDENGEKISGTWIGNGQDVSNKKGAILRMDVLDGRVEPPFDNPFAGHPKADPFIWAWGFRNPWRFSFDQVTGRCFAGSVGEDDWESVYEVLPGRNYGWRILEGSHPFVPELAVKLGINPAALERPIFEYHTSTLGRSVIGGHVYRGRAMPELRGLYVFADSSKTWWEDLEKGKKPDGSLHTLRELPNGTWSHQALFVENMPQHFVLSFAEDPTGELWVLTKSDLRPRGTTGVLSRLVG